MANRIKSEELAQWAERLCDKAEAKIEACYNQEQKAYAQSVGSSYMDASTLQLIMMGYLDANSQRARDHVKGVEAALEAPGGLFYRYLHEDDFGKPHTTFLITAFWHVEALACVGRIDEARVKFEKLITYTNHVGLLSEDVDASTGSQWGNFPQAYSHVGLMNAAYRISRKLDMPNFL